MYNKIPCDRCEKLVDGYYIFSHKTKGLWVKCPNCGNHARSYISNLFLPYKESNSYKSIHEIPVKKQVPAPQTVNKGQTTMFQVGYEAQLMYHQTGSVSRC